MSNVEVVSCPKCGQKLALQPYVIANTRIVCANKRCNATLLVLRRNPASVQKLLLAATLNADSSPESYG